MKNTKQLFLRVACFAVAIGLGSSAFAAVPNVYVALTIYNSSVGSVQLKATPKVLGSKPVRVGGTLYNAQTVSIKPGQSRTVSYGFPKSKHPAFVGVALTAGKKSCQVFTGGTPGYSYKSYWSLNTAGVAQGTTGFANAGLCDSLSTSAKWVGKTYNMVVIYQ